MRQPRVVVFNVYVSITFVPKASGGGIVTEIENWTRLRDRNGGQGNSRHGMGYSLNEATASTIGVLAFRASSPSADTGVTAYELRGRLE